MKRLLARLPRQEAGLIVVIVVLGALIALFSKPVLVRDAEAGKTYRVNSFLRAENLDKLAKDTSFFAIMAVGATFIIISGGIDLSVGSVYCIAAVGGAMFLNHFGPHGAGGGASPVFVIAGAVVVCLATGAMCGLANGLMIVVLRVHPFIITLGMMAILRGIAFLISRGQSIGWFPSAFTDEFIRQTFGTPFYPVPLSIMLVVTLAGGAMLYKMSVGRRIYAIGGNEQAGRFSGVRVSRVKVFVYLVGGLTAGIAAMIMIGYYGSASSDAGKGYELEVIAAAVVGGASLTGGRGTAFGAMLGALIIRMIDNAIIILEIDQNYSQIIIGIVIIVAVVLDQVSGRVRQRAGRPAGARG